VNLPTSPRARLRGRAAEKDHDAAAADGSDRDGSYPAEATQLGVPRCAALAGLNRKVPGEVEEARVARFSG
jgi:hypothetical protein